MVITVLFRDRVAAGRALGRRLARLRGADAVVLGLPRGGVPVAFEVATRAACQVARRLGAARVVVAVPVGAPDAVAALGTIADEVACLGQPEPFLAVGRYYDDFTPTTDAEVAALLERAGRRTPGVEVAHGVDVRERHEPCQNGTSGPSTKTGDGSCSRS